MIDATLLDILACPACKRAVRLENEHLVCVQCGRRYPIREGIPVMLLDQVDSLRDSTRPSPTPPRPISASSCS